MEGDLNYKVIINPRRVIEDAADEFTRRWNPRGKNKERTKPVTKLLNREEIPPWVLDFGQQVAAEAYDQYPTEFKGAKLYGSKVFGDEGGDIDVMVILDTEIRDNRNDIAQRLAQALERKKISTEGLDIQVVSLEEFDKATEDTFIGEAKAKGMIDVELPMPQL